MSIIYEVNSVTYVIVCFVLFIVFNAIVYLYFKFMYKSPSYNNDGDMKNKFNDVEEISNELDDLPF